MVSDPLPSGTRARLAGRRLAEGPAERPGKSLLSPLPHTESRGGRRMPPPRSAVQADSPPGGPGTRLALPEGRPPPSMRREALLSPVSSPARPSSWHFFPPPPRGPAGLPSGSGASAPPRPGAQVWTERAGHTPPTRSRAPGWCLLIRGARAWRVVRVPVVQLPAPPLSQWRRPRAHGGWPSRGSSGH